jgi:hypothetical protein
MSTYRLKSLVCCHADKSDGQPLPFVGLEDVGSGTGALATDELPIKAALDSVLYRAGDVLFSKLRPYLAKSFQGRTSGSATGELLVLRPSQDIDGRFLLYSTLSSPWLEWAETTSYGTKMPRTSWEAMSEYRLVLPSLDEQRRIADFLDAETTRIDGLRALQTTALGKLDERDRAIRDSLIDALADHVGELPFRRFVSKIEQGTSPQCENHPRESGHWGVLKLSAVKGGHFYPEENKQLPEEAAPAREYEVRDGDLLISRANTPELVGDVAVADGASRGLLLPDLIYRVGLDRGMNADFATQVLLSTRVRRLIQATARGSSQSMVKIRGEDIREWPIPRADGRQQEELVSAVKDQTESSDRLRSVITRQLTLLEERRQALISAAVTGGITV